MEIPSGSIEIQTGLWLYEYNMVISGVTYLKRKLYSGEGYCFYQTSQPENYDEDGNLLPLEQRIYAQYASLGFDMSSWTHEQLNAEFVSVPVQDGYEIVSVGTQQPETETK